MHFPFFVDLSDRHILVIGAGTIAARRVGTLCGFAGEITVVAPEIAPEIEELARSWPVMVCRRGFQEEDLSGKDLVLIATDDRRLNSEIYQMCRERQIWANTCSDQALCDFQFPSVVRQGDVVIGINASGKNHRLVKETRQKIENFLKEE
jgi:siroheme synthase-like protein